jgi:D-amino-acid dehydrogenase
MKTTVIGAGVVGTATAYYLWKHGCEVTVIERQSQAALETSFGNGGVIHVSEAETWSRPGMPMKILRWLGNEQAPLLLRYRALPEMWRWGIGFLRNCAAARFRRNTLANLRLGLFSLDALHEITTEVPIDYDRATRGVLKIYRSSEALDAATQACEVFARHGLSYRSLNPAESVAYEPALASTERSLVGTLHFPLDEVGDCRKFTQGLATWLAQHGVDFRFGVKVVGLHAQAGTAAVETDGGAVSADVVVVAAGSFTPLLLKPLGIELPICPVKGISITVPSAPWKGAIGTPTIDDENLYGLVPLGDRLRITGSAEITGYDPTVNAARAKAMVDRVISIFPEFASCYDQATAKLWTGLRPVTPTGTAFMGRTRHENLFVNAGHGHLGWTFGSGAGKLVAGLVVGKPADIGLEDFPDPRQY